MYSYRGSRIYRWQFDNNGCPSISAGNKRYNFGNDFGGLTVDPNNEQVLYHLSWGGSRLRKVSYGQKIIKHGSKDLEALQIQRIALLTFIILGEFQ